MKTSAVQLQTIAKTLATVKAEQFLFSGSLAWAGGQNITVNVSSPDLGTFGVSAEKFSQLVSQLKGEVEIYVEEG